MRELLPAYEEGSWGAVFSPDGTAIAYDSDRDQPGRPRTYVDSLADGSSRALSPPGLDLRRPSWTRDGRAVLAGTVDWRVYRIPVDGGAPELVASDTPFIEDCGDGRELRAPVLGPKQPQHLVVRDASGAEREILRLGRGEWVFGAHCDRAGTRAVFGVVVPPSREDVWLVGLDGSGKRVLTEDGARNTMPRFHPDGKSVLVSSARGGKPNLWELPLAGGAPAQLTFGEGPDVSLDVAPDGQRLLFSVSPSSVPIFAHETGGAIRRLTSRAEIVHSTLRRR